MWKLSPLFIEYMYVQTNTVSSSISSLCEDADADLPTAEETDGLLS